MASTSRSLARKLATIKPSSMPKTLSAHSRSFNASAASYKKAETSSGGDISQDKHMMEKDHSKDPQTLGKNRAKSQQQAGEGGNAVQGDSQGATAKAKREHPEAPQVIGMQDERGGKGA
ncbi:hypothetical protein BT63DRAFT_435854 [Microthyrium microscopicum]|uniref:Uncharacterized protein n=1 Tax=Microthyrium microscopicum TaxID=703497 RepID=A0A6A6UR73_9PEZI|nr:hypothetical protein BT63DRAFT_435854 [Microthyrium microscopicum]